ncbi:MAG: tetratricopeptide repeat protein [Desulfobacteraceae bacterium]|nr:tetratricopeptide repeat protein [Desulfobacteraceae bacterium]
MNSISLKQFLHFFCNDQRDSKKFCFILGAGASVSSGIPTGYTLACDWFNELKTDILPEKEFEEWVAEENIDEKKLAEHYGQIYAKRYELDPKDGYEFLEKVMEKSDPSIGYAMLAQILTTSKSNMVITTNFDSLSEDALFIYTQKKPLVIGHESLAGFIQAHTSRPCIIKLHRDLLLAPKNKDSEINNLSDNFKKSLSQIFNFYTPLVIGYGGNDGSLMDFLKSLDHIEGGIYWFVREKETGLNDRIQGLLEQHNGRTVKIPGFDELMIQTGNTLKLDRLDDDLIEIAKKRSDKYKEEFKRLTQENKTTDETKQALSDIASRGEKNWLYYLVKATEEKNPDKKESIYREGIRVLPENPEMHGIYAIFFSYEKKDYDKAETFHKSSIKLNPENSFLNGNYAHFLSDIRKNYDEAQKYYQKAIKLNPDDVYLNSNYVKHLIVSGNTDHAFQLIEKTFILIEKSMPRTRNQDMSFNLRLWYYRYAIFFEKYEDARDNVIKLLDQGIKSPRTYLDDVIKKAQELNHPDPGDLAKLAKQISAIDEA